MISLQPVTIEKVMRRKRIVYKTTVKRDIKP